MCNFEEVQNKSFLFDFLDGFKQNLHICSFHIKLNSRELITYNINRIFAHTRVNTYVKTYFIHCS